MNRLKPAGSYSGLLKQTLALNMLADSFEKELKFYRDKNYSLNENRLKELEESLESEREMNAVLTEELERLK